MEVTELRCLSISELSHRASELRRQIFDQLQIGSPSSSSGKPQKTSGSRIRQHVAGKRRVKDDGERVK
jgi:ribosomal protein L29